MNSAPFRYPLRLTVKKLSKAYGFFWALKDLNLDLPPGELVALLPNGAGKTTLLKLIAGLTPPSFGKIELDRMHSYTPMDRRELRSVSLRLPRTFMKILQCVKTWSFSPRCMAGNRCR